MFRDREQAGVELAKLLRSFEGRDVAVLGIPRGGVPVAYAMARGLRAPLDIVTVRKLQIPFDPEAGFGAVTPEGNVVLNDELVKRIHLEPDDVRKISAEVLEEVRRREREYRRGREPVDLKGRTVFVVDDGLASGYTMLAAVSSVLGRGATKVAVAVPCASSRAFSLVSRQAGDVYCIVRSDEPVFAVASFYESFPDLKDDEVRAYLDRARKEGTGPWYHNG